MRLPGLVSTHPNTGASVVGGAQDRPYLEADTDVAEAVFVGDDNVLKGDAARVGRALAHVDLLAALGDAGGVGVHDERGERLAGAGVGIARCGAPPHHRSRS